MMFENQCRKIYREAFCDPDTDFEDKLFKYCYQHCRHLEISGKTVSMVFLLPCEIVTQNEDIQAFYIYAAATAKDLRGKGYMKKLLDEIKSETDSLLFLRPADKGLINYYSALGFSEFNAISKDDGLPRVCPTDGFLKLTEKLNTPCYGTEFTVMYYNKHNLNLNTLYFPYSME